MRGVGLLLGQQNMHRTFLLNVKGLRREMGNTLVLAFTGPVPASLAAESSRWPHLIAQFCFWRFKCPFRALDAATAPPR